MRYLDNFPVKVTRFQIGGDKHVMLLREMDGKQWGHVTLTQPEAKKLIEDLKDFFDFEEPDDMSELHTDDKFMYAFGTLDESKKQTQAEWENQLIDDFDDYDTVPRDYRNRICIDDATPADWDALADKRLKARGADTPQERSLKEMQENAEDWGMYEDPPKAPLSQQIGGDHYRQGSIQPIEYIHANDMDFFSGNVVKYTTRWRYKNGLEDLKKAKHYIELLMEQEYGYNGQDD